MINEKSIAENQIRINLIPTSASATTGVRGISAQWIVDTDFTEMNAVRNAVGRAGAGVERVTIIDAGAGE